MSASARLPEVNRYGLGIMLMLASALALAGMNAAVKMLTQAGYHTFQIVLADCLFGLAALLVWLGVTRRIYWVKRVRPMLGLYVLAAICASFALFYAFGYGHLAEVSSVVAAAPLWVAILSFFFLGERLSRWQVGLVLAGFGGILMILQPGAGMKAEMTLLIALAGTFALAISQVLVRHLSRSIHTAAFILYYYAGAAFVTGVLVLGGGFWQPVALADIPVFLACASMDVMALVFMYSSFRCAPASVVSPFQYTNIVWNALIGYVIWHEQPGLWAVAGAGVIIMAGVMFTRAALMRQTGMVPQT